MLTFPISDSSSTRINEGMMIIEPFINEKILQIAHYIKAVINQSLHYTELDKFIVDTMEEWTLLNVNDETPGSAKERVFWHLVHEMSLHGAQSLGHDLYFKSEITTCLDFFTGKGSYPIDCIGWRPLP
jgi:hypothetical protein